MKRFFINQSGESNKFWSVEQLHNIYIVNWGKIGTTGRFKEKEFIKFEQCEAEILKLIKEKLNKYYVEVIDFNDVPVKEIVGYDNMNEDVFWEIIASFNWKKTGNDDAVLKPALRALISMNIEDIKQFAEILAEKLYHLDGVDYASNIGEDAYKNDNEFFSEDYFLYVRCCVVANGKAYYNHVLENPTEMPKEMDFEALIYLADEAYNKKLKTKDEFIETKYSFETFSNAKKWEVK